MNPLRKLTSLEIQKIAAGEVIERPYSIVKELVENSIDAGSSFISVNLSGSDIHTIEIIDNGIGMDQESALLSIELHTSSKCTSSDLHLSSLCTYGFRGEALAAISSCSDFSLITKKKSNLLGTKIIKQDDESFKIEEVSCPNGTQIAVSNVFKYTPVRKKFLKSNETEYNHVYDTLLSYALSNPSIHFRLKKNDSIIFDYKEVDTYKERIKQVQESYKQASSVFIDQITNTYKIYGCFSDYSYKSYNRSDIIFFVNKRRVKQYKLTQAFLKAYQGALEPNKYPFGIIFLEINPDELDVNVHPRKEEVAFLHPKKVEYFIEESIKKGLEDHIKNQIYPSSKDLFKKHNPVEISNFEIKNNPTVCSESNIEYEDFDAPLNIKNLNNIPIENNIKKDYSNLLFIPNILENKLSETESLNLKNTFDQVKISDEFNYHFLGVLHNTYILIEKEEGLLFVDQHALHERIIYEELCANHNKSLFYPLLMPLNIHIHLKEEYIEIYQDMLYKIGIKASFIKKNEIIITETSTSLHKYPLEDLIKEVIEEIHYHQDIQEIEKKIINQLYANVACKKAIKGGDVLSKTALENLLKNIYKVDSVSVCPHGRPTSVLIKTYEIEKKFKRNI